MMCTIRLWGCCISISQCHRIQRTKGYMKEECSHIDCAKLYVCVLVGNEWYIWTLHQLRKCVWSIHEPWPEADIFFKSSLTVGPFMFFKYFLHLRSNIYPSIYSICSLLCFLVKMGKKQHLFSQKQQECQISQLIVFILLHQTKPWWLSFISNRCWIPKFFDSK